MLLPAEKSTRLRDGARLAARVARRTVRRTARRATHRPHQPIVPTSEPDVQLDVPQLSIDRIELELDSLTARVALQARVLDMVTLDVGADASLDQVKLDIRGVEAQAQLKVRLDNLTAIVDRVMETVGGNLQLLAPHATTSTDR